MNDKVLEYTTGGGRFQVLRLKNDHNGNKPFWLIQDTLHVNGDVQIVLRTSGRKEPQPGNVEKNWFKNIGYNCGNGLVSQIYSEKPPQIEVQK